MSRPSADPSLPVATGETPMTPAEPDPLRFGPPGPALPPSRQRRRPSPCRDAFHRRVLPPPSTPGACAPGAWDHEEPATGVAARVLVAFATATRLPAPLHPLSPARARGAGTNARGLDPRFSRTGTKRRSSTSATNPTREHDHGIVRSPPQVRKSGANVRSRAPFAPLSGVGSATNRPKPIRHLAAEGPRRQARPKPANRRTLHRARVAPPTPETRGRSLAPQTETVTSRGFTGQGPNAAEATSDERRAARAAGFSLLQAALRRPGARALPQPDPLGHLSS